LLLGIRFAITYCTSFKRIVFDTEIMLIVEGGKYIDENNYNKYMNKWFICVKEAMHKILHF